MQSARGSAFWWIESVCLRIILGQRLQSLGLQMDSAVLLRETRTVLQTKSGTRRLKIIKCMSGECSPAVVLILEEKCWPVFVLVGGESQNEKKL